MTARPPLLSDETQDCLTKVYHRLTLIHATATAKNADNVLLDDNETAEAIIAAASEAMALLYPLRNPGIDYTTGGAR